MFNLGLRRTGLLVAMAGLAGIAMAADGAATFHPSSLPLLTSRVDPEEFGVQDETVTTISAVSFMPDSDDTAYGATAYFTSPQQARFCQPNMDIHYRATLQVPAGAVIDFVGVNTATNTDAVIGFALWDRDRYGTTTMLVGFSLPAHASFDTDYAGPLGIQVTSNVHHALVLEVENAPNPSWQYFSWVEIWWHRTVSPPPASPTFNDVPGSDFGFQYIEALAASGITGGCGGGNYCPDANLTRRQMAIFLAKALGLHWPY